MYSRVIAGAEHLLAKGVEHARTTGVSEAEMLGWRLIDDMQPLSFQFAVICNFPRAYLHRAADLPVPTDVAFDMDVAGLTAALAQAKTDVAALTPEQFAGRDEIPLTVTIGAGMSPTMPIEQWVSVFATTNIYFHLSTAYGILRSKGVQIGKIDLFAGGL